MQVYSIDEGDEFVEDLKPYVRAGLRQGIFRWLKISWRSIREVRKPNFVTTSTASATIGGNSRLCAKMCPALAFGA